MSIRDWLGERMRRFVAYLARTPDVLGMSQQESVAIERRTAQIEALAGRVRAAVHARRWEDTTRADRPHATGDDRDP